MTAIVSRASLEAAQSFVLRSGRVLERHRFACAFAGGDPGRVLAALQPYRNPDGGFGHGLEPDLRGPGSQPEPVDVALWVLDEVGAMDDPMVGRACDWLATVTTAEGGVPFVLPSALEYPRAPWWEPEPDPPAALVPTAAIAALLHNHCVARPWLEGSIAFSWRTIESNTETTLYDVRSVLPFLD